MGFSQKLSLLNLTLPECPRKWRLSGPSGWAPLAPARCLPSWSAWALACGYKAGSVLARSPVSSVVPLGWGCCPGGPLTCLSHP